MKRASLWVLWGSVALLGCGGPTQIQGQVINEKGIAVERAEVQTEPETDLALSNQKGYFILRQRIDSLNNKESAITPGIYTIKVIKEGYQTLKLEVEIKSGHNLLKPLTLKEKVLNIGDAAPDATKDKEYTPGDTSTPHIGL
ncbi:carboxypeptidase-like regulatory domain-containing protein [Myxococcota bacterium]|nr:carboxypeptidase-like regulatory domain-containing protein [Myxococcota bacterium]MBU1429408.1 carboxypeptidase-like regulatory domain-containing protein [Myxococcota bacterium]MBU1900380.1 carboxypeptidase-like regulatory domain-containing protein [Myxococcota bacterium]